jgi:hypothetical protein
MKLAIEIIKREIAQRELANKHNHLRKDEVTKELESLKKVVNFISSNPVLGDSLPSTKCDDCKGDISSNGECFCNR